MESKELLRYDVEPRAVEPGKLWVTVALENVSTEPLKGLSVGVNSLDTYGIALRNETPFIPVLDPGAWEVIPVRMNAKLPGSI